MEERVLREADIDERGLEVVFEVLHTSLEDGADEPLLFGVFDHVLFQPAVLHDGDARFELFDVDDDLSFELWFTEPVDDFLEHSFL